MSLPTTGTGFSPSTPAPPTGDQNTIPQGNNGSPLEKFSFYPQRATGSLFGTVKPDGTTIIISAGVISARPIVSTVGITIDGGGSTPTTGSKGFVQVPFAGTINGWTLIADASGSASITVKKSTFAAFPTNSSIVASAPPALSSQQNATSTTLTGWTTAVAAGDVLEFVLDSVTTFTRLTLELTITRS